MHVLILTKRRLAVLASCLAAGLLVATLAAQGLSVAAAAQKRLIPIYNVDTPEKKVCLTFDAAWGNEDTQELIDILGRYKAKATFFIVGDWVKKYPESVKAFSDAGHSIQNHSDTHPHLPKLAAEEIRKQITDCNDRIEAITGVRPTLMRAPYGDYSNAVVSVTQELSMFTIQWDVDSLDWKNPTPEAIRERVMAQVKPGSILLFHNAAQNTPAALPLVIESLQADGYSFVTVEEMIYPDNYSIDAAGKQHPAVP